MCAVCADPPRTVRSKIRHHIEIRPDANDVQYCVELNGWAASDGEPIQSVTATADGECYRLSYQRYSPGISQPNVDRSEYDHCGFRGSFFPRRTGPMPIRLGFHGAGGLISEEVIQCNVTACEPRPVGPPPVAEMDHSHPQFRYVELMQQCLIGSHHATGLELRKRTEGCCWPPSNSHTMIGLPRLRNIRDCVQAVVQDDVPGDLMEAGVWRGGACIFMRALLEAFGDNSRSVWVADSFAGLPPPNEADYPADKGDNLYTCPELAVSLGQVKSHFVKYNLLDDRVKFLKGWFRDTLPTAPVTSLAVLRLDGDMYESTMDTLRACYPKLSRGGFCIVDDYGCIAACRKAIHDYRNANGIKDAIWQVDWTGVYWRKS